MAIRAYRLCDRTRLSVFQSGVGFGADQRLRGPLRVAMLLLVRCERDHLVRIASLLGLGAKTGESDDEFGDHVLERWPGEVGAVHPQRRLSV